MKHLHRLSFNNIAENANEYTYSFGKTENISIMLSDNAIRISVYLGKIYDKDEMLSGNTYLFPDAIQKSLLLHILLFSSNIGIETITFQIDGEKETINVDSHNPQIYSLILSNLRRKNSPLWRENKTIDGILRQTKSSSDSRTAALYALLCSKDKLYESERFIYLWMAFNGMYGYLSKCLDELHKTKIKQEYKQIICMQKFLDIGSATIKSEDKSRIVHEVVSILAEHRNVTNWTGMLSDPTSEISQKIYSFLVDINGKPYNISPYGYILTQLSYYYRCNLIHANKPIALFSFSDDKEIIALKIINDILERFIDENLPKWFDKSYLSGDFNYKILNLEM